MIKKPIPEVINFDKVIKRGLRLLKEDGSTRRSLHNFNIIVKYFRLYSMFLKYKNPSDVIVKTCWVNNLNNVLFTWNFKGLSAGYSGEGVRGFKEVIDKLNEYKTDIWLGYNIKFNPLDPIEDNTIKSIY